MVAEGTAGEKGCQKGVIGAEGAPASTDNTDNTANTANADNATIARDDAASDERGSTTMVMEEMEMEIIDDHEVESETPNPIIDLISATTSLHYEQEVHALPAHASTHDDSTNSILSITNNLPKELRNLLAGGLAGMIAKSIVAPMDRIKILYQISSAEFHIRDMPTVVKKIVAEEGVSALWKGNLATLIRVFPYSGIQFMVFDRCKSWILHQQHGHQHHAHAHISPMESLCAGMVAGVTSVIATYPLDLTRAQLAVLRKKPGGALQQQHTATFTEVFYANYQRRGLSGLFRGISPTLLGILPYSGVAFALNEQAKRKIQTMTRRELTTIERMQCGALSGLLAQSLTYPLEVTRRRMQTIGIVATQGSDAAVGVLSGNTKTKTTTSARSPTVPPTMRSLIADLYAEQGLRGFFKGVSMNWFKGPVAFSISFTTFDVLQKFFETPEERELRLRHQHHHHH